MLVPLLALMGVPCVTVPVARTTSGLLSGVHVSDRLGDDARAILAARLIEALSGAPTEASSS